MRLDAPPHNNREKLQMMTKEQKDEIGRLEEAVHGLVDQALKDGMEPDSVRLVLGLALNDDLELRKRELSAGEDVQ